MRLVLILCLALTGCMRAAQPTSVKMPPTLAEGMHSIEIRDERHRLLAKYLVKAGEPFVLPPSAQLQHPEGK